MLDALRQHNGTSTSPDEAPRRAAAEENVLASLGYPSRGDSSGGFARALRIVLGIILVIVAALAIWQVAAMNGLVRIGPFSSQPTPAASTLQGLVKGTQPVVAPPQATLPATPAPAPAPAPAQQTPTAAVPPAVVKPAPTVIGPAPAVVAPVKPAPQIAAPAVVAPVKPAPQIAAAATSRPGPPRVVLPAKPEAVVPPSAAPPPACMGAAAVMPRGATVVPPIYRTPSGEVDHFKLAIYYQRIGDFENALVQYRAVLETNELNAEAHNNLGVLYQNKGLYEEAIREFQRATFIDDHYDKAHNNLGVALLKSGNTDAAVSEFRIIVARDPKSVEALTNLAIAQRAGGQAEQARETLMRTIGLNNRYAPAHYNLALVCEESGDLVRAVQHYDQFLALAGSDNAALALEVRSRVQTLRAKIQ
jgi:Flp pilus assembly protein TadD